MMVYFINHLIHSLFNFFFFQPGPYLTKNEIIKTEAPITQAKETFLLEFGLHPKDLDARQSTMVLSCFRLPFPLGTPSTDFSNWIDFEKYRPHETCL